MKLKNFQLLETDVPKGGQVMIDFGLYELSIINTGYGADQGLYEIAVFKGNYQVELPGITAQGDTVKGWLTESDIDAILLKMYTITGNKGKQI